MSDLKTKNNDVNSSMSGSNKVGNEPSDLVVGSVTFVIFIIFMTAWMYFTS